MTINSSGDVPLRIQKAVRLLPFALLAFGVWASYDQWWRGTYLPANTTLWVCQLSTRAVIDPPRIHYGSSEYGICGASIAELEEQKKAIYLWAYRGEESAKTWEPTWVLTNDPRTSAFETSMVVPAYLGPGQYRVDLHLGKVVIGQLEVEVLDPRVQN